MAVLLLVDDSRTIQKQVSMFCSTNFPDIKIVTASSGEEALALIPTIQNDICLAIFDYNMDGMTGLELIEQAKKFIPLNKIVLCSANIQEAIQTKTKEQGVRFKEKPLTNNSFIELLNEVLGSNHA